MFILILNFHIIPKDELVYVFFSRQSSRRVVIIPIFLRIFSEVEELVKSSFVFFPQIGWGPNESSNVVKIQYHHILEVEPLATYKHTVLYFLTNLRNIYITESLFSSCKYSQCPKNLFLKNKSMLTGFACWIQKHNKCFFLFHTWTGILLASCWQACILLSVLFTTWSLKLVGPQLTQN